MEVLQDIWEDYKKIILIILGVIIAIIIGITIFFAIYDPIKISFTGEDSQIIATMSNEIKIGANATNKANDKFELKWEVSAGTLSNSVGSEVLWELPNEEGTYTIFVKAGDKTVSKNITLLENKLGEITLESNDKIEYIDKDEDGLSDVYEENVSNTDKNKIDSDDDNINDGNEIALKSNSNENNEKDGTPSEEKDTLDYTINIEDMGVSAVIKGKENIASSTIDVYDLNTIKEIPAICSKVYSLTTKGNVNNVNLKINYDKDNISNNSLDENSLAIYKLDVDNNRYIKQESTINKDESYVASSVKESGKFFIADSSKMKDRISTELMFVIDNSGSMYPKEMVDGSDENDTQFKRVDLSNRLIDKLKGDYKFGAGKFTFEYEELIGLSSDREKVKEKISSIKTLTEKFSGTYIGNALKSGLEQFDGKNNNVRKYLILLTDGRDTTNISGYDKKKTELAIDEAKQKGVKIFTIGLGKDLDMDLLDKIAVQTGGKYYHASNAELLDDVFELIAADINYGFIDIDRDSNDDFIIYKNDEFLSKRNGMPIYNFSTTQNNYGATYGMSLFSKLYYENKLPSKMSNITVKDKSSGESIKANGYDIKLGKNSLENVLYDYELKDLNFMKTVPKDFMNTSVTNSLLTISDKYKKLLNSYGFLYYELEYNNPVSGFNKYENYILNTGTIGDEKFKLSETDKNFINAIYRLDILKHRDNRISFEKEPDKAYRDLISKLENKEVPILVLNDYYTVCLQKILVDINDDNNLKLEIYDSNYKGKSRYIDVKRTKLFNQIEDNNKNNYQYKFAYDNKEVSVSVSIPNVDTNL